MCQSDFVKVQQTHPWLLGLLSSKLQIWFIIAHTPVHWTIAGRYRL